MFTLSPDISIVIYLDSCTLGAGPVGEALAFKRLIESCSHHRVDIVLTPEVMAEIGVTGKASFVDNLVDVLANATIRGTKSIGNEKIVNPDLISFMDGEGKTLALEMINNYFSSRNMPSVARLSVAARQLELREDMQGFIEAHPTMDVIKDRLRAILHTHPLKHGIATGDIQLMEGRSSRGVADHYFIGHFRSDPLHNVGLLLTKDSGYKDGLGGLVFHRSHIEAPGKAHFAIEPGELSQAVQALCTQAVQQFDEMLVESCRIAIESRHSSCEYRDLFGIEACGSYGFVQFMKDIVAPAIVESRRSAVTSA